LTLQKFAVSTLSGTGFKAGDNESLHQHGMICHLWSNFLARRGLTWLSVVYRAGEKTASTKMPYLLPLQVTYILRNN